MSKQLMMNERPGDGGQPSSFGGMGGGDDWPKASIGNYKGVMLCNRPNEVGGPRKADRTGPGVPFNSRVQNDEPIGWNPTKKLLPRDLKRKKKVDPNNALLKHKKFLKGLEEQKVREKEEKEREDAEKEDKVNKFKENAEKQRKKIQDLKKTGGNVAEGNGVGEEEYEEYSPERPSEVVAARPAKLTEENLKKSEAALSQKSKPASKQSKAARPAWALTEKDVEDQKEKEIDDLLEFAYELDYEKYMDDFEVRQALAIIKDRVNEIKKDSDWKTKMAQEWNDAAVAEVREAAVKRQAAAEGDMETRSAITYNSSKTAASKKSLRSQVLEAIAEEGRGNAVEWDRSTKGGDVKKSAEDRIAQRLATEVLRDNAKLRGVHSANSIKKLLEKEAKKMLNNGEPYKGPVVSVIKEKEIKDEVDPSYLPYLHKNPAI